MKVSYPLSLKVSLWLMLNLLLLAALGIGFFAVQGGLGWGALVAGPTGERAQGLFNMIAAEASAATGEARNAVLKRFGDAYHAEFFLFTIDENQIAGAAVQLPPAVHERMEFRAPGWGFFGGPPGGRGFGGRGDGAAWAFRAASFAYVDVVRTRSGSRRKLQQVPTDHDELVAACDATAQDAGPAVDAAAHATRLTEVQRRLPVGSNAPDLSPLAAKLSADEFEALLYFLSIRFRVETGGAS